MVNNQIVDTIINKCNSDIRLILNTMDFINIPGTIPSNIPSNIPSTINQFMDSFYKDEDTNLFDFVSRIFDNVDILDIHEIYKTYETDGYILSNLIHENYLDYSDNMESIAKTADSLSFGETVFSDIYDSTREFNPNIHCTHALYLPSCYSRSDTKKNKVPIRTSVINNRFNIFLNILAKFNLANCIQLLNITFSETNNTDN